MKTTRLVMLVSLLLVWPGSMATAQDDERKTETDNNPAKEKAESEPVTLEWDIAKDEERKFRQVQTITQVYEFDFGESQVLNVNTTDYTLRCLGFTDDGGVRLEYEYDRMAMKAEAEGLDVEYDSSDPDPAELEKLPQAKGLASLVDEKFTFEIDVEMKVRNLKGWDSIRERVLQEFDEDMREQLAPTYSDEMQINMLQTSLGSLPGKPVKVGDEWTSTLTEPTGTLGTLTHEASYTLKSINETDEERFAIVAVVGEGKFHQAKDGEFKDWEVTLEEYESVGTMRYNLKNAQIEEQNIATSYKFKYVIDEETTMVLNLNMKIAVELLPDKPDEEPPESRSSNEDEHPSSD